VRLRKGKHIGEHRNGTRFPISAKSVDFGKTKSSKKKPETFQSQKFLRKGWKIPVRSSFSLLADVCFPPSFLECHSLFPLILFHTRVTLFFFRKIAVPFSDHSCKKKERSKGKVLLLSLNRYHQDNF